MGKSVTVGDRQFDAKTGLPLSDNDGNHVSHISRRTLRASQRLQTTQVKRTTSRTTKPAGAVHAKPQKSSTLNRSFTKKPAATVKQVATEKVAKSAEPATIVKRAAPRIDGIRTRRQAPLQRTARPVATKSTVVAPIKAKQAAPVKTQSAPVKDKEILVPHPVLQKVTAKQAARKQTTEATKKPTTPPPAKAIKEAAIHDALEKAPKHHAKQHKTGLTKRAKLWSAIVGCLCLLAIGGYVTYLNAPSLSVRIAAMQAGINASYPSYHPDGYALQSPVAFSSGEVSMQFISNADTNIAYTLLQSRSNWDSQALLDNYVTAQSKGNYTTSQEKGLTVYTYDGQAAWVSGGILYTISGNASLTPSQVRDIATSI